MSEEAHLVSYGDNASALFSGPTVKQAQNTLGILMQQVKRWIAAYAFSLALEILK